MLMQKEKMAIDNWNSDDLTASCPCCSSNDVVIEVSDGYFFVVRCKECGYQAY